MNVDLNTMIYAGFFLTPDSKEKLKTVFCNIIPRGVDIMNTWKVYLDHCTMIFNDGNFDDAKSENIINYLQTCYTDEHTVLTVDAIGRFENVYAFRIVKTETTDMLIKNKQPHVTCVLDPTTNKPVDSNSITDWTPIDPIRIDTVCKIISRKNGKH